MDDKLWDKVCDTFERAKKQQTELTLVKDEEDEIYISINAVSLGHARCGRCDTTYKSLDVEGKIRTNYLGINNRHDFTADISQYYMHVCLGETPADIQGFCPFFRGYIPNVTECICHWYLPDTFWKDSP